MPATKSRKTVQQLLHDRIQKTDGCWFWLGYISKKGYGTAYTGEYAPGGITTAYRFVYHVLVGPIPPGLELDHTCRNRACVNPDHLEPVTHLENIRRGAAYRTRCKWGHPFSPDNISIRDGARCCLTRERSRSKDKYSKHKERILARMRERYARLKLIRQFQVPPQSMSHQ
jgi:hypothetical protein